MMTPGINQPKEETLLELLIKERGYYQTVLEIAREENKRLEAQVPLSELKPLLEKKQVTLSAIQSIDKSLAPLKVFWQSKKDRTDPLSTKIQSELFSLNLLLSEILDIDLVSQHHAEKHLEDLRRKFSEKEEMTK